jgi:hypothetical protein
MQQAVTAGLSQPAAPVQQCCLIQVLHRWEDQQTLHDPHLLLLSLLSDAAERCC